MLPIQNPTQSPDQNGGIGNYTATVDPTATNDVSQGYAPGSRWLNQTNSRVWKCMTNTLGAATWALDGVVPGVGVEPSSMLTQFGSSTASFLEEGNVSRQISGVGISPAATGSDYVVAVYVMPALAFDASGRGLQISAAGAFAANANTKTIKLVASNTAQVVGSVTAGSPSVLASTNTVTTNGGGWQIGANVFKYGALGSNTQEAIHSQSQVGATVTALQTPATLTLVENAIIYFAVTANCATATTDVVFNWAEFNAMN
jgi:hypothetical protein